MALVNHQSSNACALLVENVDFAFIAAWLSLGLSWTEADRLFRFGSEPAFG
jgi:hypothetical protein